MKHLLSVKVAAFLAVTLFACSNLEKKSADIIVAKQIETLAESTSKAPADFTLDTSYKETTLPEHRFLRTAQLKFKVPEVIGAIQFIETRARQMGGFVNLSTLTNRINDSSSIPVSKDSLLQTIHYTTEGYLTLRVPDIRMDSMLDALKPISKFLLFREIHSDDVSLQMLTNQQSRRRSTISSRRLMQAILHNGKKLVDITEAERLLDDHVLAGDQASMNNEVLEDAVHYSTISINIYQEPSIRYEKFPKEITTEFFGESFMNRMSQSVSDNWLGVQEIILFIARFWTLLLIALLVFLLYMKHIVRTKNNRAL